MNRRSFIAWLSALPIVGRFLPKNPLQKIDIACVVDSEGQRTYKTDYLVQAIDRVSARNAQGIPPYGSIYAVGNDCDPWAFAQIKSEPLDLGNGIYIVTVTHSTRRVT